MPFRRRTLTLERTQVRTSERGTNVEQIMATHPSGNERVMIPLLKSSVWIERIPTLAAVSALRSSARDSRLRATISGWRRRGFCRQIPSCNDVDSALEAKPIIYWRIPQYIDQIKEGDRVLIWRAGKGAGFIGWGVFLTDPQHYDLSSDHDPFVKTGLPQGQNDYYAPIQVWPGGHIPKPGVATVIPQHRIVTATTAPMGTVFAIDTDNLAALQPLLDAEGYDLDRANDAPSSPLPLLLVPEPEAKPKTPAVVVGAKITPALFLLSSTPEQPVDITIEGDSLRLLLLEREAVKTVDNQTWDAVGIYLLIGKATSDDAALSVYVGKAQCLRSRIMTGHGTKDWLRCLLIQRQGLQPFNASDISWLERRLIDVLLETPEVDLINKTPPPPEMVPDYKEEILERTVVATLGVLSVLGAYVT
jgi:hypothetical protein